MDQGEDSISVGSTGTLLSLMGKEMELLQARKSCCSYNLPSTKWDDNSIGSSPAPSAFASSSVVSLGSALWSDLKGLLKSPTSAYSPSILLCKDEVNAAHGVQEACHIKSTRASKPASPNRHHCPKEKAIKDGGGGDARVEAPAIFWKGSIYIAEKGRKQHEEARSGNRRKSSELHKLSMAQGSESLRRSDKGSECWSMVDDSDAMMMKPILRSEEHTPTAPSRPLCYKNRSYSSGRSLPSVSVVDLQCCYAGTESRAGAGRPKRLSFTRLSSF